MKNNNKINKYEETSLPTNISSEKMFPYNYIVNFYKCKDISFSGVLGLNLVTNTKDFKMSKS